MRRNILLLAVIFLLAVSCAARADVAVNATNFPDAVFRQYIIDNFCEDTFVDGDTLNTDGIDSIYVASMGISSLKGIEFFTDLTKLSCRNNNLTELDVSKNTKLRTLFCDSNPFSTPLKIIDRNSTNQRLDYLNCTFPIVRTGNTYTCDIATLVKAYGLNGYEATTNYSFRIHVYSSYGNFRLKETGEPIFDVEQIDGSNVTVDEVSTGRITFTTSTSAAAFNIWINSGANSVSSHSLILVVLSGDVPVAYNGSIDSSGTDDPDNPGTSSDVDASGVAPIITTVDIPVGSTDAEYSQTFEAYGDTPITWSIASGDLPEGISLDSAGTLSGIPIEDGVFDFYVKASNSAGSDTRLFTLIVPFSEIRHPKITTTALNEGYVNSLYGQKLTATGTSTGLTTLTWNADNLPDGLTLSTTGYLSGTPTSTDSVTVTVYATNAIGTDSADFTLTISEPPAKTKPTITTESPLYPIAVGLEYYCQLTAKGTPPFKWSFKGKLPKGFTMSESGLITGTTSKKLAKVITVTVSNDFGTDTKKFTLKSYKLPQITRQYLKDATVGKAYSKSITKKGTAPFTWELEGKLPQGIKFNEKNGKITGKPVINDSG